MAPGSFQIHTESRGPHWIAWVSRDGSGKPDRSVVIIAASQAEAQARGEHLARQDQS